MTSEGSFLFENLKQIGVGCSFCNLLSWVAFWNLGIYLEGTGYFGERSDFEKSKYYNDETLENTCRKNFFLKKIIFLGKEIGGPVKRYGYKYPADYCPPGLSTWDYLRNLTWLSSCFVVFRGQRFFYGEVGGEWKCILIYFMINIIKSKFKAIYLYFQFDAHNARGSHLIRDWNEHLLTMKSLF